MAWTRSREPGWPAVIRRVALTPSAPGMFRSIAATAVGLALGLLASALMRVFRDGQMARP